MLPVAVRLVVLLLVAVASVPPENKLGAPSVALHPTLVAVFLPPSVGVLAAFGLSVALQHCVGAPASVLVCGYWPFVPPVPQSFVPPFAELVSLLIAQRQWQHASAAGHWPIGVAPVQPVPVTVNQPAASALLKA